MKEYWITCRRFTVWVQCDSNYVIWNCAPIVNKFRHKPLEWLVEWMKELGEFKLVKLGDFNN